MCYRLPTVNLGTTDLGSCVQSIFLKTNDCRSRPSSACAAKRSCMLSAQQKIFFFQYLQINL